jgi:hypothetical protein
MERVMCFVSAGARDSCGMGQAFFWHPCNLTEGHADLKLYICIGRFIQNLCPIKTFILKFYSIYPIGEKVKLDAATLFLNTQK